MTSKSPVRSCDDVDEAALSYAEIKALCAGDERIKEKMDLDIEVARLRLLKSDYISQHYRLEDNLLKYFPESIKSAKESIKGLENDLKMCEAHAGAGGDSFSPMEIQGVVCTEKGAAGAALIEACKNAKSIESENIGKYRGFDMYLSFDGLHKRYQLTLKGGMSYPTDLSSDTFGNITRINNVLSDIPTRLNSTKVHLDNLCQQAENAKSELQKPFPSERELIEKEARLALLDAELNIDGNHGAEHPNVEAAVSNTERNSARGKPSILESLKNNPTKAEKTPAPFKVGKEKKDDLSV